MTHRRHPRQLLLRCACSLGQLGHRNRRIGQIRNQCGIFLPRSTQFPPCLGLEIPPQNRIRHLPSITVVNDQGTLLRSAPSEPFLGPRLNFLVRLAEQINPKDSAQVPNRKRIARNPEVLDQHPMLERRSRHVENLGQPFHFDQPARSSRSKNSRSKISPWYVDRGSHD